MLGILGDGQHAGDMGRRSPGGQRIDPTGHLRLLTITRRVAGLSTGDRLLLIADVNEQLLRILTMAAVSRLMRDQWDGWSLRSVPQ
jgi:hypothetical protein